MQLDFEKDRLKVKIEELKERIKLMQELLYPHENLFINNILQNRKKNENISNNSSTV